MFHPFQKKETIILKISKRGEPEKRSGMEGTKRGVTIFRKKRELDYLYMLNLRIERGKYGNFSRQIRMIFPKNLTAVAKLLLTASLD